VAFLALTVGLIPLEGQASVVAGHDWYWSESGRFTVISRAAESTVSWGYPIGIEAVPENPRAFLVAVEAAKQALAERFNKRLADVRALVGVDSVVFTVHGLRPTSDEVRVRPLLGVRFDTRTAATRPYLAALTKPQDAISGFAYVASSSAHEAYRNLERFPTAEALRNASQLLQRAPNGFIEVTTSNLAVTASLVRRADPPARSAGTAPMPNRSARSGAFEFNHAAQPGVTLMWPIVLPSKAEDYQCLLMDVSRFFIGAGALSVTEVNLVNSGTEFGRSQLVVRVSALRRSASEPLSELGSTTLRTLRRAHTNAGTNTSMHGNPPPVWAAQMHFVGLDRSFASPPERCTAAPFSVAAPIVVTSTGQR
jgi:hypothetical protein